MKILKGIAVALICAVGLSGCININPIPAYAKSDDFVHILLGGIKRNINGDTLAISDLTATITDADGVAHNVRIAQLYRSYPDYSSQLSVNNLDRSHAVYGHTLPYDGGWWVTLRLASPNTQQGPGSPLPLAVGFATISITSPTGKLIQTNADPYEGNYNNFNLEILEGVANTGIYDDKQYIAYAPSRSLTIKPDDLGATSFIGGVQIKIDYVTANLDAATAVPPMIVPISHDPNINVIQHTVDNQDGTKSIIMMVTNPNGFVPIESWVIGQSSLSDLSFLLVTDRPTSYMNWETTFTVDAVESYYIDASGDEIVGIEPELIDPLQ
jgi:hypothetical protein